MPAASPSTFPVARNLTEMILAFATVIVTLSDFISLKASLRDDSHR